jgi:ligand-binding sensor domain-containing protein
MAEDAEGHMWFATLGGVSTFDGTTVTTYTVANGLPHTDAFSILIDRTGAVWVGTTGGVCRMDPRSAKRFMPVALPEAIGTDDQFQGTHNKVVWRMKEDRHGRIWFATNGAGIVCIDGMKVSRLTTADGLLDDRVPDLTFDAQGNLWYITMRSGIGRYDGQRFKNYTDADDVELKGGWCIDVDRKGNIWFNGFGQGVYRFDGTRFMAFSRKDGLMQLSVQSLLFTSDGRSFFGTGAGLYQLRDGRFFNFTKNNGC